MKYIFLSILFFFAILLNSLGQNNPQGIADKIARKLKDSLSLTDSQKDQIYSVNIQLHNQKMNARNLYPNPDSLSRKIQRIENTRDSLYHLVLSDEQYKQYRIKKKNLVNNN